MAKMVNVSSLSHPQTLPVVSKPLLWPQQAQRGRADLVCDTWRPSLNFAKFSSPKVCQQAIK